MLKRKAFTLIELIFAIMIIAISVLSLPMMNQSITKGVTGNIIQEAIFAASTELNEAVTAHWDENSLEPDQPNSLARIIDGSIQECENNSSLATYRLMKGHISQPLHRRCLDDNTTEAGDSSDDDNITALDDMEHTALETIFENSTAEAAGYKDEYKSKLIVTRPADFNGTNYNMKMLEATITDSNDNTVVVLRSYSANIGEVDYYKRTY